MVVERKITDLSLDDCERRKFDLNEDDEVIVRTSAEISGEITPVGLSEGGLITEVTLSSTSWNALPSTSLTNRRQLNIQNRSGLEIKINYDNTETAYIGVIIPDGAKDNI
jgi:hypothetical protein